MNLEVGIVLVGLVSVDLDLKKTLKTTDMDGPNGNV